MFCFLRNVNFDNSQSIPSLSILLNQILLHKKTLLGAFDFLFWHSVLLLYQVNFASSCSKLAVVVFYIL